MGLEGHTNVIRKDLSVIVCKIINERSKVCPDLGRGKYQPYPDNCIFLLSCSPSFNSVYAIAAEWH